MSKLRRDRRCKLCHQHRALFSFRGRVKADRDHELCFRCFRSACQRQKAREIA